MKRKGLALLFALLAFSCAKEQALPEVQPVLTTVRAGFAESEPPTRSRLDFNEGETEARVLWTAGDQFKTLAYSLNDGKLHSARFTTEEDGTTQAEFTANTTLSGRYFASGYPASAYTRAGAHNTEDDSFILITPVPSLQQAVPGGVEEGLIRAAAWSDTFGADLTFHNMLSIIRFRLEGDIVPSVASVSFNACTTVAGEASVYLKDGEPVIDFSHNWTVKEVERSSSITLEGPFTAGMDYCMAMVPVDLPGGFNMIFRDAEGHELYKLSSKPLTLRRSRIMDFGTIRLADSWETEIPEVWPYMVQTEGTKKNVICLVSEGFRQEEMGKFAMMAESATDFLFKTEPYKSYKDWFTVYFLSVASNESGASVTDGGGNIVTERDTYFHARWGGDSYSDMTADTDIVREFIRTRCPEVASGELDYKDVPVALLVNDNRYGGICKIFTNGWNYCIVPYAKDGGASRWSYPDVQAVCPWDDSEGYRETTEEERDELGRSVGDWRNSFLHEFGGHCYARLTDEYWSSAKYTAPEDITGHSYPVPYALNVSGYYDEAPWKEDLLDRLDEWTGRNPDYGRIGIWHGAQKSLYYRWRAEKVSCMIDNRPYFSAWQRILIVRKIMDKAGEFFDMQSFIEKDVTFDPVRPAAGATSSVRRQARSQALLVPEMPMTPSPVIVDGESDK